MLSSVKAVIGEKGAAQLSRLSVDALKAMTRKHISNLFPHLSVEKAAEVAALIERERESVAVIGTAGRGDDEKRMTADVFAFMKERTVAAIQTQFGLQLRHVRLVSGGSSWADHIAVVIFLEGRVPSLELHLPCAWDRDRFVDTGQSSWMTNPGW